MDRKELILNGVKLALSLYKSGIYNRDDLLYDIKLANEELAELRDIQYLELCDMLNYDL